jgi:MFS family permease
LATEIARDGFPHLYGPLIAINGVLIVVLQPYAASFVGRFRVVHVLPAGSLLVGLGFFVVAFADGPAMHAVSIVLWTFGEILLAATTPTLIARLAPPHRRGAYQGFYSLSWSVAAFAPALCAVVLERIGSLALWGACLGVAVVAAAVQGSIRDRRLG